MTTALRTYRARMQRVLDHIERHLDGELGLDELSRVAACSKFHFHRQFTATFGLPVHRYVQLARMKRASYRLAYRDAQSVTDIALDAGYDAPDYPGGYGYSPAYVGPPVSLDFSYREYRGDRGWRGHRDRRWR